MLGFSYRVYNWLVDLYLGTLTGKWPGVHSTAIGHTCWIDDQLHTALKDGINQIIILGSGYDCRAYRLRGIEKTCIYELDHPAPFGAKVRHLGRLLPVIPENVTFVKVDFAHQDFAKVLNNSSCDRTVPYFLSLGRCNALSFC